MTYTVVFVREEDGRYAVSVPALPGCHTWGENLPHAVQMVEEAMECHLESLQAHGDPIPSNTSTFEVDMGDAAEAVIHKVRVALQPPVP
jgi:antitoxin HicB